MKYQPNQSIVDYNDWLPEGNWVDLGYDNAPTEDQLRSQIEAGEHNDAYGDLGCPDCGNVDLFWKTHSSKGQRYRCLSCEYSSNWETVKSQGDLTLQKFGLTVDCPLCSETISAYNRASIDSHFRKHKKEEAEAAEASEPKVSEAEWDMNIDWNSRCPKCGKSADNPVRTKEYDGYVRTTYYCDCDVGQPNPDFENRFISEYLRWFGSPASNADQVLSGHTSVKAYCMGHHDFFPRDTSFIGYDVEEIEALEEMFYVNYGIRVSLPRPKPEQTLGPDDLWLEVYSKPSSSKPSGDAGESTCAKCVEKLMSGATYNRGHRPKAMIRWSDWKNDDWDKTVELSSVSMKSEWQEEVEWNDKPKKKTEPEWEDVEWEAEAPEQPRKCCECSTTEGLTTIQAGTFCWDCLPINLGAEEMFYYHGTDMTNLASILKEGIRPTIDTDSRWGEDIMDISPYPYYYAEIDDILPSVFVADSAEEARWWADESGIENIGVLKISSQVENLENFHGDGNGYKTSETIPKEYIVEVIDKTFDAEDDYWAGSVAKAIVNEMGDDYYFNEDLHEYNCVHFAQEMSGYLTQDGIPHEIQSFAGYGGEVAHAWVYVPSEGEYYDAWTPYGVSDWKDLDFWETVDYTPEWLEQQTPESFEAEDSWILEMYEKPDFTGSRGQINVWREQVAPEGTIVYRAMPETDYNIALGLGYLPSASHNVTILKKYDYAVFTSFSPTPTRFQSSQSYSEKFEMEYPIYEIDISGLQVFIIEPELGNQGIIVAVIEPISVDRITPLSWDEDYKMTLRAEDNYDSTYGKAQAKIRRKLKNKIKQQAIMGTKAGQWSARKSQELKRQYETACQKKGLQPYKGSKTKKQQDLSDWSKQKWKTASGKKSSITGEPYFPAKAVAALKQKNLYAKAKRQKAAATKAGKQNARYSDDIRAVVKQFRAEESGSPTPTQLLNWLSQPKTITTETTETSEKPVEDWEREPTRCVWCSSGDIDSETPEHQEEGLIYSYVGCKDCGCIWREEYRYVENEIIEEGEKRILKSEDEQLQIEIEGIDETYGLIPSDPEMLSLAESAVSQYLSRTDLPETFQLHTNPHFVFVSADAFGRSSHVARFRSQTSSHIPIIMLSSEAIRESADDYGVSLKTAVETTVWHELGHVLCELWDMEEIYPFESYNDEEEFAESIAESMYFQESFQNPVV